MAKQVAKIKLTGRLARNHLTALERNQLTLTIENNPFGVFPDTGCSFKRHFMLLLIRQVLFIVPLERHGSVLL